MTELVFDGQKIIYNEFNDLVKIDIGSPFITAWKKLNWGFQSEGFGINAKIIDFVLAKKVRLFVHLVEGNKNYIIENEKLQWFLSAHKTVYKISGVTLNVIAIKDFKEL